MAKMSLGFMQKVAVNAWFAANIERAKDIGWTEAAKEAEAALGFPVSRSHIKFFAEVNGVVSHRGRKLRSTLASRDNGVSGLPSNEHRLDVLGYAIDSACQELANAFRSLGEAQLADRLRELGGMAWRTTEGYQRWRCHEGEITEEECRQILSKEAQEVGK
jgi:hypothetical protein